MLRKLLYWGFNGNTWVWFHIMAGGIGAKLALQFLGRWESLIAIAVCAVGWEVVEFYLDGGLIGMVRIYGTLERWLYDCAGDIIGAVLIAFVVVV